jgi:hypothetical protein
VAKFGEDLKAPSCDAEVISVSSVWVVVVEDCFEGLGASSSEPVGGDVKSVDGVGCDDLEPLFSKGSNTAPW